MALRELYKKFREQWKDKPDKTTPVTAEALNHIEQGIYANSNKMALKEIYDDNSINLSKTSTSIGDCSVAEGFGTIAYSDYQHVEGTYNLVDTNSKYIHIAGNGNRSDSRSNAYTLDREGNAWFAGGVESVGKKISFDLSASGTTIYISQIVIEGVGHNGTLMVGGFYFGTLVFSNIPPFALVLNVSAIKYSDSTTEIEGTAKLINSFASSTSQLYGNTFSGKIEVENLNYDSSLSTSCKAYLKVIFDLEGISQNTITVNAPSSAIYKTLNYYYPINQLRTDLTEKIESLEQRIAELERSE